MDTSRKILVIEDAEPLRNDIIEMLKFEGFEVRGAENGVIGVDVAFSFQPDLIICDIMMPEMDGYGVLDRLRKDTRTVSVPFIFLTAKTDRTDVRHGMGLGADDYLTKPFIASELLETIHARLEKQQTMREIVEARIRDLSDNIITALPHELRTPLNTIIGFSDMLMMEAQRLKPNQVAEWAQHINEAAQRLYRLVENYLLYVRAEVIARNREEMIALQEVYVTHPDTIVQFQASHKAHLFVRADDLVMDMIDGEVNVNVTDHDLGKVVEEVVDNAFKFSEPGTPVTVTSEVHDDKYVITVADKGRGMTREQVESIGVHMQFERWFYEQQGSGLGLAIAQRFVRLYRGRLEVESQEGVGTAVRIMFYVKR
ncbi:MAG: hybrid sensor histidine kinase/response regulator [Chloroflexota bacterium]